MNDRIVLAGVVILVANLFVLFTGLYSVNYYLFLGALILGVIIVVAGAVLKGAREKLLPATASKTV